MWRECRGTMSCADSRRENTDRDYWSRKVIQQPSTLLAHRTPNVVPEFPPHKSPSKLIFIPPPHSFMNATRNIDITVSSVCHHVRSSVTLWHRVKTAKRFVKVLSRPDFLVFSQPIAVSRLEKVTTTGSEIQQRSARDSVSRKRC